MLAKQGAQGTAVQVFAHVIIWQLAQPEATQCSFQYRLAAIALPITLNSYRRLFATLLEMPGVAAAEQAIMSGQFGQAVWGAMPLQVAGRGAQIHTPGGEPSGNHA